MTAQILALIIFLAMFVLIILEVWDRHLITLGCGLLTLVLVFGLGMRSMSAVWETLNVKSIFTTAFWYAAGESSEASSGINWQTIIFIAGMMIMVEGMARVGFFRWLCMRLAKLVKYQVIPIFMTFMVLSFVLAMFIDSITVILFLAAVTIELSKLLEFNPVPMILSEIFCANLGGSATMCGDPPNIIIGTSLGFTFMDFIKNTGLIAVIALVVVVIYFYFIFHKELEKNGAAKKDPSQYPDPAEAITSKGGFIASSVIFLCAVVLLVTHAQTGLTVSTIGVCIAVATLIAAGKEGPGLLKKIDYQTLLFFIGLFVVVGGLEQTGVLKILAGIIEKVSGGNIALMIAIIVIVSAVASAFIDNIPYVATMLPVVQGIAGLMNGGAGFPPELFYFGLLTGATLGGNLTPIGASANIAAIGILRKQGEQVRTRDFLRIGIPFTLAAVLTGYVYLWLVWGA